MERACPFHAFPKLYTRWSRSVSFDRCYSGTCAIPPTGATRHTFYYVSDSPDIHVMAMRQNISNLWVEECLTVHDTSVYISEADGTERFKSVDSTVANRSVRNKERWLVKQQWWWIHWDKYRLLYHQLSQWGTAYGRGHRSRYSVKDSTRRNTCICKSSSTQCRLYVSEIHWIPYYIPPPS